MELVQYSDTFEVILLKQTKGNGQVRHSHISRGFVDVHAAAASDQGSGARMRSYHHMSRAIRPTVALAAAMGSTSFAVPSSHAKRG